MKVIRFIFTLGSFFSSHRWVFSSSNALVKPGARVAAAIELLEELDAHWQQGGRTPADVALAQYYRQRRFIGSKDRREISRQVYGVLRHDAQLEWWLKRSGRVRSPRGMVLGGLVFLEV